MQMKNQLCKLVKFVPIAGDRYDCTRLFVLAILRMAGSLQKSTEVMQTMHNLIKVPEVAATMRELSKEMMKVC